MNKPIYFTSILLVVTVLISCGGGASNGATSNTPDTSVVTAPGSPTGLIVTAGDAAATITFTAPTASGGAVISKYTATCLTAASSVSGSATTSPINVMGLLNGTNYSCTVVATNSAGNSIASTAVSVMPTAAAGNGTGTNNSTAGVACALSYSAFNSSAKVSAMSTSNWTCSASLRSLNGNGVPDHAVTTGNFATPISAQNIMITMPLAPNLVSTTGTATANPGYVLNSVKLDPATAGTCASNATSTANGGGCVAAMGTDPWKLEAMGGSFLFGTDESNAHVQPNGQYHYHGVPEAYVAKLNKGKAMTLVGFAVDGFPIYARYGYASANDANSAVIALTPSYRKKATADAGRPSLTVFAMGTFTSDYEYVPGLGDLDECNGRNGVTPEFPKGIYHYLITDTFPFIQRCIKGSR